MQCTWNFSLGHCCGIKSIELFCSGRYFHVAEFRGEVLVGRATPDIGHTQYSTDMTPEEIHREEDRLSEDLSCGGSSRNS